MRVIKMMLEIRAVPIKNPYGVHYSTQWCILPIFCPVYFSCTTFHASKDLLWYGRNTYGLISFTKGDSKNPIASLRPNIVFEKKWKYFRKDFNPIFYALAAKNLLQLSCQSAKHINFLNLELVPLLSTYLLNFVPCNSPWHSS